MNANVIPFPSGQNGYNPSNGVAVLQRESRAERAATLTQRNAQEIERLPFDLSALEDEGVFINVDATGFGLLDRRLDWQALGVQLPTNTDVNFTPPRCGLLPNRYRRPLLTPVSRAHTALHKYSYQFRLTETLFETPAYRWVPWRAFSEFEAAFQQATESMNAARQNVLDDYEEICLEVLATFRRVAMDSEQRLVATGAVVPEDFVERVVRKVLSAFPTREELQRKLQLRYQVGVILLGSEMLREQRLAAEERRHLEQAEAETRTTRLHLRVVEQTAQQHIWAEQERTRLQLAAEAEERQREAEVKERLRQMKLDAAREKLQETLSPLQEGAAQLRAQIYESAQAMHEALQKHDFLPGATAKKARQLARWFRLMNFQSDTELDQLLGQLEQLAAKPTRQSKRRTSNATVKAVLDDIIQLCYRDANAVSQPNRLAALEL
ncbi:MAG: hypothetical protein JNM09_17370 [Blastocatellia bacterium]|nr:hypothetical protein [Blastocatellia bacterium]